MEIERQIESEKWKEKACRDVKSHFDHFSPFLMSQGTDQWTDGPTDGPTDGRADGRTFLLIEMRGDAERCIEKRLSKIWLSYWYFWSLEALRWAPG